MSLKHQPKKELIAFRRDTRILIGIMVALLVFLVPLVELLDKIGVAIYAVIFLLAFYYAFKVEKHFTLLNIQTYKEARDLFSGDSIEEVNKRSYSENQTLQKASILIWIIVYTLIITLVKMWIFSRI